MHRPGLLRSAGVVGGLGPVHHGGVGGGLGLAVRVGGTTEGSPGGSVRSGGPGGSRSQCTDPSEAKDGGEIKWSSTELL